MSAKNSLLVHPDKCTHLEIWAPKYSTAYGSEQEWCVMLAKYKVDQASPVIIIDFTKAKHLIGQRYAIKKSEAIKYKVDTNGKIPVYVVPMSKLESWESHQEIWKVINEVFK